VSQKEPNTNSIPPRDEDDSVVTDTRTTSTVFQIISVTQEKEGAVCDPGDGSNKDGLSTGSNSRSRRMWMMLAILSGVSLLGVSTGFVVYAMLKKDDDGNKLSSNMPPGWFLAASGKCSDIVYTPGNFVSNGTDFVANVSFEFETKSLMSFRDAPSHASSVVHPVGNGTGKDDLSSPLWDKKNIALVSSHKIAVFDVVQHEAIEASSGEASSGDFVSVISYTGFVSNSTSTDFKDGDCQLFVDTESWEPDMLSLFGGVG
tara:strand:+ start:1129 stop:1905 length:777 start_codon:yes stop_codon:yes gene_type:complete